MPHYPDEIEYSDKYYDDWYEYRHVILPKEVYRRLPRGRLLTESVSVQSLRNGAQWEFNSPAGGHTTRCTVLSPTFCYFAGLEELTLKLDFHHGTLSHPQISSFQQRYDMQHSLTNSYKRDVSIVKMILE